MLKPRTHLLLEPDTELYKPFLNPLLEQKDSTYKLIAESGILWNTYKNIEQHLAHQPLAHDDPRVEQPNNALLFIANLGYYPQKSYQGFASITTLMIHQLLSAVRTRSIFQQYGLVRMLVWMQDKEKRVILPRVIPWRKKFAVEAEILCEKISEIAGSDELATIGRRERSLDLDGARIVRSKMQEAGVKTPKSRMGQLEREAAGNGDEDTRSGVVRPFLKDLEEMEAKYARKEFCSYHDADGSPVYIMPGDNTKVHLRNGRRTPEWLQLLALRYRAAHLNKAASTNDQFLTEYDSIMDSLSKLEGSQGEEADEARTALRARKKKWLADMEALTGNQEALVWTRLDDRRAFRQDPPILLWDRREAEPLKVNTTDFFPQHEMCLLDFEPKPFWPLFRGQNSANYDYVDFVLAALFSHPTHSIVRALKSLAPGADEWIIPRCPSLRDTSKGGSADLDLLSVRTLNQEMVRELMEAWMGWPFRPTKAGMLSRTDARPGFFDDEDEMVPTVGSI